VDTTSRGTAATGTLTFLNGSTEFPGTTVLSPGISSTGYAQATATLPGVSLPLGTNTLTVQYAGDTNYNSSTSAAITVTVAPDFALSAGGTGGSVMTISSPGGSGSLTLTVTGQTGYTGTVNFTSTACKGLPLYSTCSFSPASVTGSGNSTLTVKTTAAHAVPAQAGSRLARCGPRWVALLSRGYSFWECRQESAHGDRSVPSCC